MPNYCYKLIFKIQTSSCNLRTALCFMLIVTQCIHYLYSKFWAEINCCKIFYSLHSIISLFEICNLFSKLIDFTRKWMIVQHKNFTGHVFSLIVYKIKSLVTLHAYQMVNIIYIWNKTLREIGIPSSLR